MGLYPIYNWGAPPCGLKKKLSIGIIIRMMWKNKQCPEPPKQLDIPSACHKPIHPYIVFIDIPFHVPTRNPPVI